MTPSDPNAVRVTVDVHVPFGAPTGATLAVPTADGDFPFPLDMLFIPSFPATGGVTHTVKTNSSSALGSICAEVKYANAPYAVKARCYPAAYFPGGFNPPVPADAVPGMSQSGGQTWVWTDANTIPAADHSATGAPNTLGIWKKQTSGSAYRFDGSLDFFGITGTTGPCGSGSGSGGGMVAAGQLYPVVWLCNGGGFADPLTGLNARWYLGQTLLDPRPTWDNRGDGKATARVVLTLDPKAGWELVVTFLGAEVRYTAPSTGSAFGPIRFVGAKAAAREYKAAPDVTLAPS